MKTQRSTKTSEVKTNNLRLKQVRFFPLCNDFKEKVKKKNELFWLVTSCHVQYRNRNIWYTAILMSPRQYIQQLYKCVYDSRCQWMAGSMWQNNYHSPLLCCLEKLIMLSVSLFIAVTQKHLFFCPSIDTNLCDDEHNFPPAFAYERDSRGENDKKSLDSFAKKRKTEKTRGRSCSYLSFDGIC